MAQKTQTLKLLKAESPKPWYVRLLSGALEDTSTIWVMAGRRLSLKERLVPAGSLRSAAISRALRLIGYPLNYLTGLYLNANLRRAAMELETALENLEAAVGPHDPQVLQCKATLRLTQETLASQKKPHKPKRA